jgi:hypothetical protein
MARLTAQQIDIMDALDQWASDHGVRWEKHEHRYIALVSMIEGLIERRRASDGSHSRGESSTVWQAEKSSGVPAKPRRRRRDDKGDR